MFIKEGRNLVLFYLVTVILVSTTADEAVKPPKLWEDDDKIIENVVRTVDKIEKIHPDSRFYGLGGDPEWIVEAKKKVKAYMPKNSSSFHHCQHIPFSESFQEEKRRVIHGDYTIVVSRKKLTAEQTSHYEKLLHELGLNPKEIYDQYEEFQRKTVIIEVTSRHRYSVVFAKILFDWAKRENVDLKDALKIVTVSAQGNKITPVNVIFSANGRLNLTCDNVYTDKKLLETLSNATEQQGPSSSKIVPNYPAEDWVKPVPAFPKNERVKKIIKKIDRYARIYAALQKYDKDVALTTAADERFAPRLTLNSRPKDGTPSVRYDVISMSTGRNNDACTNLGLYTNNRVNYYFKDADIGERYHGIVNEPLYLLFTHGTTGVNTLNENVWLALTMKWGFLRSQKTFEQFVIDEIADKSTRAHQIFEEACAARSAKKQAAAGKVEQSKSPEPAPNEIPMILRADKNFNEIDFQIPSVSTVLPAFLSICAVQLKGRTKRDLKESSSPYASFSENPFYMIFNYNTTKEDSLNVHVLKNLWGQYAMVPRNTSFIQYLNEQMSNSTSLTARYLKRACDRRYNVNQDENSRKSLDSEVYEKEGFLHKTLVSAPLKVLNFLGSSVRTAEGWLGGSFLFDWDKSTHGPTLHPLEDHL